MLRLGPLLVDRPTVKVTGLDVRTGRLSLGLELLTRDAARDTARRIVQVLEQLAGHPVDLEWDVDLRHAGWWRIESVTERIRRMTDTVTWLDVDVSLAAVGRDGQLEWETQLDQAPASNVHGIVAERWHAPPPAAVRYTAGAGAPSTLVRAGESGNVTLWRGLPAATHPRWAVGLAGWWGSGVSVEIDGLGVAGGVSTDTPTDVVLANDLVRVTPAATSGRIDVAHWDPDAAAWVTKGWTVRAAGAGVGVWESATVLDADPEQATVRLSASQSPGRVEVDLTLRRGARHVSGVVKRHAAATLVVRPSDAEAGTAITGGVRATANDADGNRYVVGTAQAHATDLVIGGIFAAAVAVLDFSLGLEVGGSGAAAGDTAADLLAQHLAPMVAVTMPVALGGRTMSVTVRHRAAGSWSLTLRDDTPRQVRDLLTVGGVVAITPGPARSLDDTILDQARYVGVVLKPGRRDAPTLDGQGLAWYLGDHQQIGPVFDVELTLTDVTFANGLRAIIGVHGEVAEGTFHAVDGAPTASSAFRWVTLRQAIDAWCDLFDCEWTVRADSTPQLVLDAGPADDLYDTDPDVLVVRHGAGGRDLDLEALPPRSLETSEDLYDWSSGTWLLPEGVGENVSKGAKFAPAGTNPYRNLAGDPLTHVRVTADAGTEHIHAQARAQLLQNRYSTPARHVRLSTDRYDITGVVDVGGWVWVFDPDAGVYDVAVTKLLGGRRVHPQLLRVQALTWPVVPAAAGQRGMGVYYRAGDGTGLWTDLTGWVAPESGEVGVEVGASARDPLATSEPPTLRPGSDPDDGRTPATPALTPPFDAYNYLDTEGRTRTAVTVTWTEPVLNDDGSTVTDGDRVEIGWRQDGAAADAWSTITAEWGAGQVTLFGLDPGVVYEARAAAVDVHGNRSAWSGSTSFTALADTIPPAQPAPPAAAAGSPQQVLVTHQLGVAAGGTFNLPDDLDHLEVHLGTTSTFAVTSASHIGDLAANAGMLALAIAAVGSFQVEVTQGDQDRWVKVVAVDRTGNRSDPSASTAVTPNLVDTAYIKDAAIATAKIGDLAVTNAKIANLAVTNAKIADLDAVKITAGLLDAARIEAGSLRTDKLVVGSFDNLARNPGFESDFDEWEVVASGGGAWSIRDDAAQSRSGRRALNYSQTGQAAGARVDAFSNGAAGQTGHPAAAEGDKFYAEVWVRQVQSTANRVQIGIFWRDADGGAVGASVFSPWVTPTGAWQKVTVTGTAPPGVAYANPHLAVENSGNAVGQVIFDDVYVRRQIGTALIEDAAITTAKIGTAQITTATIADLAVTSAKVASLAASKITAGTINTGEILVASTLSLSGTGMLRTATAGKHLRITQSEADRLSFYDGSTLENSLGIFDATNANAIRVSGLFKVGANLTVEGNLILDTGVAQVSSLNVAVGGLVVNNSGKVTTSLDVLGNYLIDGNVVVDNDSATGLWTLAGGSNFGHRFRGGPNGHLGLQLFPNDGQDQLIVGAPSNPYGPEVLMRARADGRFYAQGAYDWTTASGANLHVTSSGHFFRSTSSARYKANVRPARARAAAMGASLDDVEPVTFNGRGDESAQEFFGVTAESVAAALGDDAHLLVGFDTEGRPDWVMYDRLALAMVVRLTDRIRTLEEATA